MINMKDVIYCSKHDEIFDWGSPCPKSKYDDHTDSRSWIKVGRMTNLEFKIMKLELKKDSFNVYGWIK